MVVETLFDVMLLKVNCFAADEGKSLICIVHRSTVFIEDSFADLFLCVCGTLHIFTKNIVK